MTNCGTSKAQMLSMQEHALGAEDRSAAPGMASRIRLTTKMSVTAYLLNTHW